MLESEIVFNVEETFCLYFFNVLMNKKQGGMSMKSNKANVVKNAERY